MANISNIKKPLLESFICVFVLMLVTHWIMAFHEYFLHDALYAVNTLADNSFQIGLGRYLQPVYRFIRGNDTIPWLITLLASVFLSLSVYIISKLLDFKKRISLILISGIFATNTTMSLSYSSYIPWVDIYMLSMLFAVIAVYFCLKYRFGFVFGSVFICLSLALYQSYISVAVGLFMLLCIKRLIDGKRCGDVVRFGLKGIATVLLGGALYWGSYKLILALSGVAESNAYNSLSHLSSFSEVGVFLQLRYAYTAFVHELCGIIGGAEILFPLLLAIISVCSICLLVSLIMKRKLQKASVLLIAVLILLFPLGANCIRFVSASVYHELMAFGCFTVYLLPIMLTEEEPEWGHRCIISGAIAAIILCNIVFAYRLYRQREYTYSETARVMDELVDYIESQPGFVHGETKIVFLGGLANEHPDPQYDGIANSTLYNNNTLGVTYYATYYSYLENIMHYDYAYISNDDATALRTLPEVAAMPSYPADGCCLIIGDAIIVKLSQ